jgi:hypothetical protein
MARYLCADRPQPILGQDPATDRPGRGLTAPGRPDAGRPELPAHGRGESGRGGHEPMRPPAADTARRESRPGRGLDPIRSGRDALLASLERPLGTPTEPAARTTDPAAPAAGLAPRPPARQGGPLGPAGGTGSAFDEDADAPKEVPAVPSLAVLRPRRSAAAGGTEPNPAGEKRKRLPSWDDVLFGSAPARESS